MLLVNFLFVPLKLGVFAVALPGLIRSKLQRLRHPKRAVGSFPFRTPMRDSATDYLAARHAHLPIARFLLRRQSHDAGVPAATALPTAGASPPPSAAPPIAPMLDELLHLGATQRDRTGGDPGDARSVSTGRGEIRSRSRRLRRRAGGTTLALLALSLVLFMPATLQGIVVEELIVVLVSFVMVAALAAESIARLCAAAWAELVHAGAAAVAVPLAAAAAVLAAWVIVRARGAHRRAAKARLGGALDAEMPRRAPGLWCWPVARGRTANAALVSLVASHGTPSRTHGLPSTQVAPA